jgi:hypothetical protein
MKGTIMTDNLRDTKFAGFAELQFNKLSELGLVALADARNFPDNPDRLIELQNDMNQLTKLILAQSAYDLVFHTLYETSQGMDRVFGIPYKLEQVPDLTAWPPTSTEP